MRALRFQRSLPRYAAARVAGGMVPGLGARVGPLDLADIDEPGLPGPGWQRIRPRLAGICGSDLTTIDGKSSRYFEPLVSFPFVPGHEIVADADDGRVVVEPVLGCVPRGIDPPCPFCASGRTGSCQNIALGNLQPGLQTGYCTDTGGGWATALVAHDSQLHRVPDDMADEAAVMVEPAACAVHAARRPVVLEPQTVVVLGAGTVGLCTIAAARGHLRPGTLVASAKHPEQRKLAVELGADVVVEPGEVRRAVRRLTRSPMVGDSVGTGADVVFDCVGSADSIDDALAIVRPRGDVVLVGMPGRVSVDLTGLWHKEIRLAGAYAYGVEEGGARTFDLAFELVVDAGLGRLVSAAYPLDRYREAIDHAANAGSRGAVKVVFDLRGERNR
ncbi:MAG TPA: zinc-binding dehydrogenase [Acidimicrobiales bacterium]|nr:zinc-binding dehydrogenase [Acidimicrobiales bacterium]